MKLFPSLALPTVAAAFVTAMPSGRSTSLAAPQPEKLKWTYSLAEARKQAQREHKLILIDFSTTWCGPCKMLDEYTYSTDAFKREAKKWVLLRIDGDKNPQLCVKYEVTGFPTILFATANGNSIGQLSGYWEAKTLIAQMRQAKGEKVPPKG